MITGFYQCLPKEIGYMMSKVLVESSLHLVEKLMFCCVDDSFSNLSRTGNHLVFEHVSSVGSLMWYLINNMRQRFTRQGLLGSPFRKLTFGKARDWEKIFEIPWSYIRAHSLSYGILWTGIAIHDFSKLRQGGRPMSIPASIYLGKDWEQS
jgi:hypothetical protein